MICLSLNKVLSINLNSVHKNVPIKELLTTLTTNTKKSKLTSLNKVHLHQSTVTNSKFTKTIKDMLLSRITKDPVCSQDQIKWRELHKSHTKLNKAKQAHQIANSVPSIAQPALSVVNRAVLNFNPVIFTLKLVDKLSKLRCIWV